MRNERTLLSPRLHPPSPPKQPQWNKVSKRETFSSYHSREKKSIKERTGWLIAIIRLPQLLIVNTKKKLQQLRGCSGDITSELRDWFPSARHDIFIKRNSSTNGEYTEIVRKSTNCVTAVATLFKGTRWSFTSRYNNVFPIAKPRVA